MAATDLRYSLMCAVLATTLLLPPFASGQAQGTLAGAVLDTLGARVPGATVTLLGNQGLAGERTVDVEGSYEFTGLTPGRYQVAVAAAGFAPSTSESLNVAVMNDRSATTGATELPMKKMAPR